ncbi:hypothetical protein QJS04_geneDACA022528 [Acorus gramineus]|uniref:Uncharacterized protein n=1 Tax=Acorus gramineus TaxID=55184 RepID=A0AAV9A7Q5_ACOGR|nr:hypothetical protein QJS04_geneDACA022528 [Acorus gramineus]
MVEHAWPIAAGPSVGSVAGAAAAAAAAAATAAGEERWRHFDNSVNALSFGFVATAILISMFLVMAIFERFLRSRSHLRQNSGSRGPSDLESQQHYQQGRAFAGKLDFPSPKMSIYAKGVSVLMPGHDIPTFIAHPAPPPCPPERVSWPDHQPFRINNST